MKKGILLGSVVAFLFLGCTTQPYKTEIGVDPCGRKYVDSVYREYIEEGCVCQEQSCTLNKPKEVVKQVEPPKEKPQIVLKKTVPMRLSVIGQGVAPCNGTCSPAQAYAMAKRAAIVDAYRLLGEKVKGVYVDGQDYIENMMVKRSRVRTSVNAVIQNANIVDSTFRDGLCEVEMEILLSYDTFVR
jgi:hypothetical protein